MIHNCQHCGAWFTADEINKALKNKDLLITCRFCALDNEIGSIRSSNVDSGFERLKMGDFYDASVYFSYAKDEAKRYKSDKTGASHEVTYDAYIGEAMAQSLVQVIYAEDDPEHQNLPRIICHKCNEQYLADNDSFIKARADIMRELRHDSQSLNDEIARLDFYEKYVDGIKEEYERIKEESRGKEYSVFIAYEDDPDLFSHSGYETAIKIKNNLPDELAKGVFLPDMEDYGSADNVEDRIKYEAAILYAIVNSNCMLVVCDDSIDSRLIDLYTRFYFHNNKCKGKKGANLAFIRYCGKVNITLPDKTLAQSNVFDFNDVSKYNDFALNKNGYLSFGGGIQEDPTEGTEEIDPGEIETLSNDSHVDLTKPYIFLEKKSKAKFLLFGSYPQHHVTDTDVTEYFEKFDKPDFDEDNGWNVLYKDRYGYAYTWYRDETVNGKRYRGIYFMDYREVYSVQDSDIDPSEQRAYKYLPRRVHCFAYSPIVWQIAEMSSDMAVLVSALAIDSMEYNNHDMTSDWNVSTLHSWLNSVFYNTAFTEEEKQYLRLYAGSSEDDKVYLLDRKSSFDKNFYKHQAHLSGSDYYRCIGGQGSGIYNDPTASCYWINVDDDDLDPNQAMTVHPGNRVYVCNQYVDCSTVAVVPKIILKLD